MKIIYDLEKKDFFHSEFDTIKPKNENLLIGFRNNDALPVNFGDFSLLIETYDGEELMFSEIFPAEGVKVVYTDEEYSIDYTIFSLNPENEYRIVLSANHDGHTKIFDKNFYVSNIPPYPSWTWNEKEQDWRPPIPRPEEGRFTWDEKTGNWTPFEV